MKAGKALNERKVEIRIQFRPPAAELTSNLDPLRNELVIRLQPDEAIYLKMVSLYMYDVQAGACASEWAPVGVNEREVCCKDEACGAHQSCAEPFWEGRHHCKSRFDSFHAIPYGLGCGARCDSSDILA